MSHAEESVAAHAAERDAQDNMHMDDINIPLVAVAVVFFGILLAVVIISLQAWFYNQQTRMRAEVTYAREDVRTDLGKLLQKQRMELHEPEKAASRDPAPAPGAPTQPAKKRMTIDAAMAAIAKNGAK